MRPKILHLMVPAIAGLPNPRRVTIPVFGSEDVIGSRTTPQVRPSAARLIDAARTLRGVRTLSARVHR